MFWFWAGIAVFGIGMIVRYVFKVRYYKDYTAHAHTDLQCQEIRSRYRPLIFIGTGIQLLGCIISIIALYLIESAD